MKRNKSYTHTQTKKLICDWTDKKKNIVHSRMLKVCVGHGMIFDKVHEIISFKESKWLEKYINPNTQKNKQS